MSEELNREQALVEVVRWALGQSETDEFPGLPEDWPRRKFYWRHELRRRFNAALGRRGAQEEPRGLDITAIIQRVAELPDRTSPADWPDAMLVTGDELAWILTEAELASAALRGVGVEAGAHGGVGTPQDSISDSKEAATRKDAGLLATAPRCMPPAFESESVPTWQPIETAPRDGQTIRIRQGNLAPVHAFWKSGDGWRIIEYEGPDRPTHWQPKSPQLVPLGTLHQEEKADQ